MKPETRRRLGERRAFDLTPYLHLWDKRERIVMEAIYTPKRDWPNLEGVAALITRPWPGHPDYVCTVSNVKRLENRALAKVGLAYIRGEIGK